MATSCVDVCDVVVERLLELRALLDLDGADHDDVLEALSQVEFVPSFEPDEVPFEIHALP